MKRCIHFIVAFCLLLEMLVLPLPVFSQTSDTANLQTGNGLHIVTFSVPQGKIKVYLPDDMAAGDTVSGTISTDPVGSSDTEKNQNRGTLEGYVIDLGDGTKVSAAKPSFRWTPLVPKPQIPPRYVLKIVEVAGTAGGKHTPAAVLTIPAAPPPSPVPSNFTLPTLGQTGRPITIAGPFDGNASNTGCTVDDKPASVIAESPRKAVLQLPADPTGPTEIKVNEGGKQASGQFRNIGVNLTAPKTSLLKGEKTTLTIQVTGLQGITANIPLDVITTGSVNMQGGNTQNLQIQPGQVNSNGNFTQTFDLTGIQAGNFNVTGTVVTGGPAVGNNNCNCVCEFADPPIIPSGSGGSKRTGHYSYKPSMAKAGCTGSKCSVKSTEYSWSVGAGSTAIYTVVGGDKSSRELSVDVTGDGTLELSVTVTIKCSDGTTCTATGSKTFDVKK